MQHSDSEDDFVDLGSSLQQHPKRVPEREIIANPIKVSKAHVREEEAFVDDVDFNQSAQVYETPGIPEPDHDEPLDPIIPSTTSSNASGFLMNQSLPDLSSLIHYDNAENSKKPSECIQYVQDILVDYEKCKSELELISSKLLGKGFSDLESCFLKIEQDRRVNVAMRNEIVNLESDQQELFLVKQELQEKDEELNQVKSQLVIVEQAVRDLKGVLQNSQERTNLKMMLQEKEEELTEMKKLVKNFEVNEKELQQTITSMKMAVASAEADKEALRKNMGSVVQREIRSLSDRHGELIQNIEDQTMELSKKTEELSTMEERYSLQTAELNSLRDQHFDQEKTAEKMQVQQIQIDLMKSDFEAQRQELIAVRARLSDAISMKILNASITNWSSVWKNRAEEFGIIGLAHRVYRSDIFSNDAKEWVEMSLHEQMQVHRMQFISEHPPRKMSLHNEQGNLLQTCQFERTADQIYEMVLVNPEAFKSFRLEVHECHEDFFSLKQVLVFGY